jgi:hypothetical protein
MTDKLHLVRDFSVHVRASHAEIEGPAGVATVRLEGLFALLSRFEGGATLAEVLASMPARGALDWMEQTAVVRELVGVGALAHEATGPAHRGFGAPGIHVQMLHDVERVLAYLRAIEELVRPDDVVVDLGTGTGILAVAAARAGARHVYAIEESTIGDTAEEVFAANGLADRITLVRGHSTHVELPERGTLLVSETLGNDPLDEGFLPFVADARRRLLVPGARVIPAALDVLVQLVEAPLGGTLSEAVVAEWARTYGVDLHPFFERHRGALVRFSHDPHTLATLARCSEPVLVEHLRFDAEVEPSKASIAGLRATRSAEHAGVAVGYDAHLSPGVRLSVGPHAPPGPRPVHWTYPIFARVEPMPVEPGTPVPVRLTRGRTSYRLELG